MPFDFENGQQLLNARESLILAQSNIAGILVQRSEFFTNKRTEIEEKAGIDFIITSSLIQEESMLESRDGEYLNMLKASVLEPFSTERERRDLEITKRNSFLKLTYDFFEKYQIYPMDFITETMPLGLSLDFIVSLANAEREVKGEMSINVAPKIPPKSNSSTRYNDAENDEVFENPNSEDEAQSEAGRVTPPDYDTQEEDGDQEVPEESARGGPSLAPSNPHGNRPNPFALGHEV
jgi:hypothetical protein